MGSVPTIYTFLAKATGGQNVSMKMKVYEGYGWSNRVAKDGTAMCFVKHSHADTPYHKDAFVKGPVMIGVAQGQWLKARGQHSPETLHIPRSYLIGGHDQIPIPEVLIEILQVTGRGPGGFFRIESVIDPVVLTQSVETPGTVNELPNASGLRPGDRPSLESAFHHCQINQIFR